jgi:hypothetical protein
LPARARHSSSSAEGGGSLDRRAERLVETRHHKREADGFFRLPRNFVATVERQEVERVDRGEGYASAKTGSGSA